MKVQILRRVESARLADVLPPPLRRRLPGTLRRGGPYTVLVFPLGQDPVRSGAVAKAVARLRDGDAEPVLAFGAGFTADALAILEGRGIAVVSVGDFHWTDEAFERIRTSVASPRKAPGLRREPAPMPSSLGLESGTVRVAPYDPAWPSLFDAAAVEITAALRGLPLSLEHVGSTAVPDLPAKPIIDILAGRPVGSPVGPYVEALERAGYEHRGERGVPGRAYFRRGSPRAYHVHLFELGTAPWRHHLAFRDALRADPVLRAEYASLKAQLAARHPRDREAYTIGKEPFIGRVLDAHTPRGTR